MGVEPALPRRLLQEDQQEPYGRRLPYVSRAQLLDVTNVPPAYLLKVYSYLFFEKRGAETVVHGSAQSAHSIKRPSSRLSSNAAARWPAVCAHKKWPVVL
jgi:hypothetical protein